MNASVLDPKELIFKTVRPSLSFKSQLPLQVKCDPSEILDRDCFPARSNVEGSDKVLLGSAHY